MQQGVRYHWRASGCLFLRVNDTKRWEKLKEAGKVKWDDSGHSHLHFHVLLPLASCCNVFHTFCIAASNYRVVCNLHAIMVYNAKARRWILSTAARRPWTAPIALPIPSFCNLSSDRKGYAISVRFVAHPTICSRV